MNCCVFWLKMWYLYRQIIRLCNEPIIESVFTSYREWPMPLFVLSSIRLEFNQRIMCCFPYSCNCWSFSLISIREIFSAHLHETTEARDYFIYIIMFQIHSLTDERFIDVVWDYPDIYQRPLVEFRDKNKLSIYVPLPWLFWNSLLRQAETPLDILTVTIDITMVCTFNVFIWWIVLQLIRVLIEISEATKTLN